MYLIEFDTVGRLGIDGGQFDVGEPVGQVGELAVEAEAAAARRAVAVVALHVLGVHRHEAQHQQIHTTGHDGQSEQDEHHAERRVARPVRQRAVVLFHSVPKYQSFKWIATVHK